MAATRGTERCSGTRHPDPVDLGRRRRLTRSADVPSSDLVLRCTAAARLSPSADVKSLRAGVGGVEVYRCRYSVRHVIRLVSGRVLLHLFRLNLE